MGSKQQDFFQDEKLWPEADPLRKVFCNRTMNMRRIGAVGFDMDYTLIHYHVDQWERCAFERLQKTLSEAGFPAQDVEFNPQFIMRGLIIDRQLGNILKANRYGYIKKAYHGTHQLDFEEQRRYYNRVWVDPHDKRFAFLNTLFGVSEGCMYSQLVDKLEAGEFKEHISYSDLYDTVRSALNTAHLEGHLKRAILADPGRFVDPDPDLLMTLRDLREAGKKLLLITNSDWEYTNSMMKYVLAPHLNPDEKWRDLFDLVVVNAGKPDFFAGNNRFFEVVDEDTGLLKPVTTPLEFGKAYLGGCAQQVEKLLNMDGEEILYVGDHIVDDILISKSVLRWRTCLIIRELENELKAEQAFENNRRFIEEMMHRKEQMEYEQCQLKLLLMRKHKNYDQLDIDGHIINERLTEINEDLKKLDELLAPMAIASGQVYNQSWGPILRVGSEQSYYCAQLEGGADIYTSRVTNFLYSTPFAFFRA